MRLTALAGAGLTALLLAGCGGSSEMTMTPGMAPEGAPMPAAEMAKDQATTAVTTAPQVIKTASTTIEVADVPAGSAQVVALAGQFSGSVQNQDQSNADGVSYANLVVRIPADQLDAFMEALNGIGTVQSLSIAAADVTPQVLDIEARIASLEASIARLEELQSQAANVADLVAIETELANRQGELDSLTSQRDYYADQVAMSTVYISLTPTSAQGIVTPDFAGGLQQGWQALLNFLAFAVTAAGFLLPVLLLAGVITIVVLAIVRAVRRRRRQGAASSETISSSSSG